MQTERRTDAAPADDIETILRPTLMPVIDCVLSNVQRQRQENRAMHAHLLERARATRNSLVKLVGEFEEMRTQASALLDESAGSLPLDDLVDVASLDRDIADTLETLTKRDKRIEDMERIARERGW